MIRRFADGLVTPNCYLHAPNKSQIANPRLRQEIEAEIKFAEWTAGGVLRHTEFVTVRES